jgi:lysozyme family protein
MALYINGKEITKNTFVGLEDHISAVTAHMSAVNEHISDVNEHISTVETHMGTVTSHMQTVSSHLSSSHVSSVNSESGAVTIEAGDDTVTVSKDQGKITIKSNVTGTDSSGEIEILAEKTGPLAYNKTTGVLTVSGNSFSELSIDGNLKVSGVVNIGTEGGVETEREEVVGEGVVVGW